MKTSAALGFSVVFLGVASLGLNIQNQANAAAHPRTPERITATLQSDADDIDLLGVIGDEMISNCNLPAESCGKAWQELRAIAKQKSL